MGVWAAVRRLALWRQLWIIIWETVAAIIIIIDELEFSVIYAFQRIDKSFVGCLCIRTYANELIPDDGLGNLVQYLLQA